MGGLEPVSDQLPLKGGISEVMDGARRLHNSHSSYSSHSSHGRHGKNMRHERNLRQQLGQHFPDDIRVGFALAALHGLALEEID